MEKFTVHTGTAVPLRRSNVDTDQIIPAVYLKRVTRSGFEDGLFRSCRGNALKEGLLPVELDTAAIEWLWDAVDFEPELAVTVDLETRQVRAGGHTWAFPLDDFSRWRLLEGLDDIGLTLRHDALISTYETTRPAFKPAVH